MVQWLGLGAFTAGTQVQSLVGELRSHKLRGASKEKKSCVLEVHQVGGKILKESILGFEKWMEFR